MGLSWAKHGPPTECSARAALSARGGARRPCRWQRRQASYYCTPRTRRAGRPCACERLSFPLAGGRAARLPVARTDAFPDTDPDAYFDVNPDADVYPDAFFDANPDAYFDVYPVADSNLDAIADALSAAVGAELGPRRVGNQGG